ncbi:MAG: TylF/MycF/NovP-related O-methyltransferase [Bdellovibrionota bacterium]
MKFFDFQFSIQRGLYLWGYELRKYKFQTTAYEPIFTQSTRAPWNTDLEFSKAYESVKYHTLIDRYRSYGLWQLCHQSKKIKGAIVEIGSWRGGSGALLAIQSKLSGRNEPVYLCDTFRGLVKVDPDDKFFKKGNLAVTRKEAESLIVDQLKLSNVVILEGVFPDETGKLLDCEAVRLCHIDVDTYSSAKDALDFVWGRLTPGGLVVFDDYGSHACPGIAQLFNEQADKNDRVAIYNLNGQALLYKLPLP